MFCLANSPWAAPVLTLAGRTLAWVAPAGRQGDMSDSTDRPAVAVSALPLSETVPVSGSLRPFTTGNSSRHSCVTD